MFGEFTSLREVNLPLGKKVDLCEARVKSRAESPTKSWYYCDTLYVGPPTIAMLGKATGEQKYYDYLMASARPNSCGLYRL
mmetsp:Transcript_29176/g.64323  ORF Transcript_29176/g.64323 Transcript_29176/m.64323 type:complete len:81 (-) Transcript_29176:60-302(-)